MDRGRFEALLYLGARNKHRLLELLWFECGIDGPYLDYKVASQNQPKLQSLENVVLGSLYGTVSLSNKLTACSSYVVKDEDGVWIYFGFPLGSLGNVFDIGAYPFDDGKVHGWTIEVSQYLKNIALNRHSSTLFDGAIIGWLTADEVDKLSSAIRSGVPKEWWHWYLVNEEGNLAWYPQNKNEPLMQIQP